MALGQRVLIVDETGDYLPLGLAECLASAGVAVEIVTPRPFLGADTQRTLDMPHVLPRLKKLGVRITAQHFVESIDADQAIIYDIWGGDPEPRRGIDSVVIAMTQSPSNAPAALEHFPQAQVHHIGDVVAPRRIEAIYFEAEKLGRSI